MKIENFEVDLATGTCEFKDVYEQVRLTRAAVRGFINYLKKYGSSD